MKSSGKSRPLTYAAVIITVTVFLAISIFFHKENKSITYTRQQMGTVVEITLMDGDRARFDEAAEEAFAEIKRLEGLLSSYSPQSDVSRVSKAAGIEAVKVSPETLDVVEKAIYMAELSGGAFDPTVGVLGKAWGFSGESGTVPDKREVEKLLSLIDYKQIEVNRAESRVGLKKTGMVFNLGGIAKGYIVNRAAEVLKKEGVTRAIVHAGGDMVMFRKTPDKPFKIGIQHPREKKLLGEVYVENGAVSTSGDYERYFEKGGVRYHHILDPKTGYPAARSRSVTIVADDASIADGLSTAVFVMGPEAGMELVRRLKAEALIVDANGKIILSDGFKGKIYDEKAR